MTSKVNEESTVDAVAQPTVKIRISAMIDNEYATRAPDQLPLDKLKEGASVLTLEEAKAVLEDAKYNSDLQAQDIGPDAMPLAVFNAYRALARQTEAAIKAATGGGE